MGAAGTAVNTPVHLLFGPRDISGAHMFSWSVYPFSQ